MTDGNRTTALVFGGLFLGVWLWIVLFEDPSWLGWGVLGLVMAAALYGGRLANEAMRNITWVALGIALGLMLTAALLRETTQLIATLLTFTGGAMVVSGLPVPEPAPPHHA